MTAETEERIIEQLATVNEQLKHFATKEDLANLRAELANVRTDLHKDITALLKWMIVLQAPTWLGIFGLLIAVIFHK